MPIRRRCFWPRPPGIAMTAPGCAIYWQRQANLALKTLRGHSGWIDSVAFSPDGQRVATAAGDNSAAIWETATGRLLLRVRGHSSWVKSVAFSPDGKQIIT